MWLPLQIHGLAPFKAALREKILLARYYMEELRKIEHMKIVNEPELSIFAYRYENPAFSADENNLVNKTLIEQIHQDGKVFLSSTTIDGLVCLRIAILSFRSHKFELDLAIEEIKSKIPPIIANFKA